MIIDNICGDFINLISTKSRRYMLIRVRITFIEQWHRLSKTYSLRPNLNARLGFKWAKYCSWQITILSQKVQLLSLLINAAARGTGESGDFLLPWSAWEASGSLWSPHPDSLGWFFYFYFDDTSELFYFFLFHLLPLSLTCGCDSLYCDYLFWENFWMVDV